MFLFFNLKQLVKIFRQKCDSSPKLKMQSKSHCKHFLYLLPSLALSPDPEPSFNLLHITPPRSPAQPKQTPMNPPNTQRQTHKHTDTHRTTKKQTELGQTARDPQT